MSHEKPLEEVHYEEYVRIKVKQHLLTFPEKAFTLLDLMIQLFDFPVEQVTTEWAKGLDKDDKILYIRMREIISGMNIYYKEQIRMKKVGKEMYYYIDFRAI